MEHDVDENVGNTFRQDYFKINIHNAFSTFQKVEPLLHKCVCVCACMPLVIMIKAGLMTDRNFHIISSFLKDNTPPYIIFSSCFVENFIRETIVEKFHSFHHHFPLIYRRCSRMCVSVHCERIIFYVKKAPPTHVLKSGHSSVKRYDDGKLWVRASYTLTHAMHHSSSLLMMRR